MRSKVSIFVLLVGVVLGFCVADGPTPAPAGPITAAERVAQLTRLIEDSEKEFKEIQNFLDNPSSEYSLAEMDFNEIDRKLSELKNMLLKAIEEKRADEVTKLQAEAARSQKIWDSRKQRFNLAIEQRKAMVDKLALLKTSIEKDRQFLNSIQGKDQPKDVVGPMLPTNPSPAVSQEKTPEAAPQPKPSPPSTVTVLPGVALPTGPSEAGKDKPVVPLLVVEETKELRAAREQAAARKADSEKDQRNAEMLANRVKLIEKALQLETQMLSTEHQTLEKTKATLLALQKLLDQDKPDDEIDIVQLTERIRDTEERLGASQNRAENMSKRVTALNAELEAAKAEQVEAEAQVNQSIQDAEKAEETVAELMNPFRAENLFKKAIDHGPAVLGILAAMILIHLMVRQFAKYIVRFMVRNNNRGSELDCQNRSSTLIGVFRYSATLFIFGGGVVMILDEIGLPVVPLMGGAAVMGLAIAFGAQNLIRDYFTGFMILMEDQYGINDVVRIGNISGSVEKITLRVTVLRDLEGTVHFVPHGTITMVSNLTHSWSRAVMDLTVHHSEDIDRVISVIIGLGTELQLDPMFVTKMDGGLEVLGVDRLDASGATIRFLMKTRPLQQWAVKREMLKRINKRFVELGIRFAPARHAITHEFPQGGSETTISNNRFASHLNGPTMETLNRSA